MEIVLLASYSCDGFAPPIACPFCCVTVVCAMLGGSVKLIASQWVEGGVGITTLTASSKWLDCTHVGVRPRKSSEMR